MGLMVHSLPDAHVCGKLSCGSCSQVLTTPKHPCDRFILIYLVAEVRHLESGHRSYHLCWNGRSLNFLRLSSLPTSQSFSCVRLFLPGSSVHGVLQAIKLEWVAIPFSRRSSQPGDRAQVSRTIVYCKASIYRRNHLMGISEACSFLMLLKQQCFVTCCCVNPFLANNSRGE